MTYLTYISVDLAHHEILRAKVGKGGIKAGILQAYPYKVYAAEDGRSFVTV